MQRIKAPEGSNIQIKDNFNGPSLSWRYSNKEENRYFGAIFLLFWLGGWAFGEYFALIAVFSPGMPLFGRIFLLIWLAGWTVGGSAAIHEVVRLFSPPPQESITLTNDTFIYHPGRPLDYYPGEPVSHAPANLFSFFRVVQRIRRMPIEIRKKDLNEFVLEWFSERQHLRFDFGELRIEIGESLSEPEREWLYGILENWRLS